jgi:succinate dehydrogenase/fumarate reductase flavoprotein subunit
MTRNKHLFTPQMENEENYKAIALRQQQRVHFTYIPRELLNMPQDSELGVIRDGDILAVACDQHSWARGVEIKHLLIAKWMEGRLHFYHATTNGLGLAGMDAYTYMRDKLTMIGVAVYRFKDNR